MFSRFFIERPIFANVIAIVTMLLGVVALLALPIEQFPPITPPTVQVTTSYPGADAIVLADTVAAPIEQQVNGVEGMIYMSSTCASDGSYKLTVTFNVGTNLDMAQVLVQNRVAIAQPKLPEDVKLQGVTVTKQSTAIVQIITLTASDTSQNGLTLANYAYQSIRDELSRVPGVGDVTIFGSSEYAMRIWLDPIKLKARNLTVEDVRAAIKEQNKQAAAGTLGGAPSPEGTILENTITTLGRLEDKEAFENIIIKKGEGKRLTYLKDVARIELGAQTYSMYCEKSGKSAAGIAIYQLPGANALALAKNIEKKMKDLEPGIHAKGIVYDIPFDTTKFVEVSVHEVYKTLIEAGVLVLIVILVFLQDWRAVLVPATTIPVTIIGAFVFMIAFGFSINMLTLFGLVLAIGIVVDDAIVIVENAAHHIEQGLDPKSATIKAMSEILGPIIGITCVLLAVFVPTAFLGGITGQLYRQFALTIAATALISAINAMTLKPAQCAVYLRPVHGQKNWFFRGFNAVYEVCERFYVGGVRRCVRFSAVMMLVYVGLIVLTVVWFMNLPTGFLPVEDQGYVIIGVQLPDARTLNVTHEVTQKVDAILKDTKGVRTWITIGGNSLLDGANASNAAAIYVVFEDWHERSAPELHQDAIVQTLRQKVSTIQDAIVFVVIPPSIQGLGVANGFQMQLQYKGTGNLRDQLEQLESFTDILREDGNQTPSLTNLNSSFRSNVPQLFLDINKTQIKAYDVSLETVYNALQGYLGSMYVNDFTRDGRTCQVRMQAEALSRATIEDIKRIEVTSISDSSKKVPLGAILNVKKSYGPLIVNRYNLYPSAAITGEAAAGYSSGQALNGMEELARETLPPDSLGFEWTGVSYQERQVGNQSYLVFGLAVLLVFLVLAAQYESWTSPAAVILVVPLGLLGAAAAVWARGMDVNVYTQIGLVLIIALASKNAILIVEVAREQRAHGKSIVEASVEASRLRLRPILMTSFAFILGLAPLLVADSAGAASQRALGTAVFGGMITSTFLAVYFVPVFYVVMQSFSEWFSPVKSSEAIAATVPH